MNFLKYLFIITSIIIPTSSFCMMEEIPSLGNSQHSYQSFSDLCSTTKETLQLPAKIEREDDNQSVTSTLSIPQRLSIFCCCCMKKSN